ncbi:Eco57I restriction-modification methylase domain-containing protein [Natrinema versiforme]|uniref:site-specific DNA-methyltransferase (adenine-specific) n=1 Tax=Natrinema versiforme JCM 10478 TaxID=1227496 RepID=L9XZF3_9EURY|nr:N-6 DNA methylase [Natrinema versiforme]ELY66857.1 putative restriction/modification enzyme [Natrinema versiforme JCM 10478]
MSSQTTLDSTPFDNSGLFSDHYLKNTVSETEQWDCDAEAEAAFDALTELWEAERDVVDSYLESELQDVWIDEVVSLLGYDAVTETPIPSDRGHVDYVLFSSSSVRRRARSLDDLNETYAKSTGILEAKQWDADFESEYVDRPYRNASSQIRHYLDRTPEPIRWGFLTNGRKWRIYSNRVYETQIYYEVDLVDLIENGRLSDFKYFYAFFHRDALTGAIGESFLDTVYRESEIYAEQLGEDLQDNVFTALRVLGEGFVDCNDLDVTAEGEAARRELKEQSLVYLYRLMFVLYAEGKGLIHPESERAKRDYESEFSLERIREDIVEEAGSGEYFDDFSAHSRSYWDRLDRLFELIDTGNDDLGIPAYNGGLFAAEEHQFLEENYVSNDYLARAIYYLSTTTSDDGDLIYANYGDLDTRHLGSVYEGLLEHRFEIAEEQLWAVAADDGQVWVTEEAFAEYDDYIDTVEEGGLYVVNDEGERRSTGSYYTPDYIVQYIVSQTLDPLIEDIRESLETDGYEPGTHEYAGEFYARVLELNILDPAMGSGHFLTAVTSYLADQVQAVTLEADISGVMNEEEIRRAIAKECIFGVDLNEMAVELAKLSMWLETLASNKPLTFLDHHFKQGNSLLGADLDDIDDLPGSDTRADVADGQATLDPFLNTVQDTIDSYLREYAAFARMDDDTVEQIGKKKAKYEEEVEGEEKRERLDQLANVYLATHFGVAVPDDAYENLKQALRGDHETPWEAFEEKPWFQRAQDAADEHDFFHWKLEFVEAFYTDGQTKSERGFDAVVGNPPYFNLETVADEAFTDCLERRYPDVYAGKADIHYFFCGLGFELLRDGGQLGYIVSRYFTEAHYARGLRESLSSSADIHEIVDLGNNQVFPGVDTLTVIMRLAKGRPVDETTITYLRDELESDPRKIQQTIEKIVSAEETDLGGQYSMAESSFGADRWGILPKSILDIKETIRDAGTPLGENYRTGQGLMTGLNEAFTVSPEEIDEWGIEDDVVKPLVKNGDLRKYEYNPRGLDVLYFEGKHIEDYPNAMDYLSQYREQLDDRAKDSVEWYEYLNPINKEIFEDETREKIICPFTATENRFYLDQTGLYNDGGDIEVIVPEADGVPENEYVACLLNSTLLEFFHLNHAKLKRDGYYEYFGNSLQAIPLIMSPAATDADTASIPADAFDAGVPADIEAALVDVYHELVELLEERRALRDALDPFKYISRDAPTEDFEAVLAEELKYATRVDDIAFESRHDIDRLTLANSEESDEWLLRARLKLREATDDGDYDWKRNEEGNGIVRRWVDLYEFPADLVDETRLETYVVVLDHYDEFANKSPKSGYPGGKTRTVQAKLERADLPVVDNADLTPHFELRDEIAAREAEIRELYRAVDDIVYDMYDLSDEEIETVESEIGVGLTLE